MIRPEKTFYSWGGKASAGSRGADLAWRGDALPTGERRMLAYGMGRSYGDSCLLDDGCLVETRRMDHLIAFDPETGVIRCEAGCTLAQLLEFSVPRGWFVPVTPGTKFVTVGGCVANDVHGKNHHRVGTFGCFVTRFGLRRSDGSERECSPEQHAGLFSATIGGLGLTGVIVWVELRLRRIASPFIQQQTETLHGVDAFFDVARRDEAKFEHSVAWLDTTHAGEPRGVFIAGNHSDETRAAPPVRSEPRFSLPITLPNFSLGAWSIRLLNSSYYNVNAHRSGERSVHYDPFFYPLDAVAHWNRAYGRQGLVQYQFVVAMEHGPAALRESIEKLQASGQASFLTVVKLFGEVASPGMLSFPRPGVTVCFDFPHRGAATESLLDDLDRTVFGFGGALYPAKDSRMDQAAFERSFPRHREFKAWIDPACCSNFARRTGLTA
jgi:FAD/FMN-containing dehydrogenase